MSKKQGGNMDQIITIAAIFAVGGALTMLIAGHLSTDKAKDEIKEKIEALRPAPIHEKEPGGPSAEISATRTQLEELEEKVNSLENMYAADSEYWRTENDKQHNDIQELRKDVDDFRKKSLAAIKFAPLDIKPLRVNLVHYQAKDLRKKSVAKKPETKIKETK